MQIFTNEHSQNFTLYKKMQFMYYKYIMILQNVQECIFFRDKFANVRYFL